MAKTGNCMVKFSRRAISLLLLTWLTTALQAKDNDFASWMDLSASKSWHATTLGIMGEFYTRDNSTTLERTSIGLKGEYALTPWLFAGSGYLLMNYKRPGYMELRNRYYLQLEPVWHHARFELSMRERIQITSFPESRTNAITSYYWRSRLEAIYSIPNKKLKPVASIESFYFLQQTTSRRVDELRLLLGAYYHISGTQTIKCYGLISDGENLKRFVLGVNYEFEL